MAETDLPQDVLDRRTVKKAEYDKKKAALRYRLMGFAAHDREWFRAVRALDFGIQHHKGYRKDKVTPTFMHQIEITLYLLTLLPHLTFPVRTVVAGLLHDTPEDTRISHEEIRDGFGVDAMIDVELLTKEYRGEKKDPKFYFGELAKSPVASISKGCDRIHNQGSMAGVFKLEKQIEYTVETRTYFFDFLKQARRSFPEQELAYENIKFVLLTQIRVFESINAQGFAA